MFLYKKERPKLTEKQEKEEELKKTILFVVVLTIGFIIVLAMTKQLKTDINSYDDSLYVDQNVDTLDGIKNIKPLYPDKKTDKSDFNTIEIDNTDLYEQVTDATYIEYEKYVSEYENVLKAFDKNKIKYIKFLVTSNNITTYYYLLNDNLFKSSSNYSYDELLSNVNLLTNEQEVDLKLLNNKNIDTIYKIIELDTATEFGKYLEYVTDKNYYNIASNKQNSFDAIAMVDDNEYTLSVVNFTELIQYLGESDEETNN